MIRPKGMLFGAALVLSVAAQAAVVQWDGSSTDITSLGANVVAVPGGFTADDQTWDTAYNLIPAQGEQAAVKAAMSQIQQYHKTMQINGGQVSLFFGGGGNTNQLAGGLPKVDVTAGFSQLYAFNTSLFDAAGALTNLSVTVREREPADVCSFRWFVVSGGTPYISASVAADVGTARTTYTIDPLSEVWYAFDGAANLEAAVGASVGTLSLTNVTYAGVMTTVDTLADQKNWRGMYVYQFFAETDGAGANQPPFADPQSVEVKENTFVDITLTGSDPEGSNVTYFVESDPTNGVLTGATNVWTYTPNTNYTGPDSFTFTVNDGEQDSEPATVLITVNTNRPPVANAQSVIVEVDSTVDITLTGNDQDGDDLSYTVADLPTNGLLSATTGTNLTYTPNAGYTGPDSFTFTVNDGETNSAPATVSIAVYTPPTGGLYFEDFSTDPGYIGNNLTSIGGDTTNGAGTYFTFEEYNGTPEIGVTTGTGALHLDSNTAGGSARSRGLSVFIDTSAAGIGIYTVSFEVTNWVAGTGTAGFKVLRGSGLDTGYIDMDNSDNNAAANVPRQIAGTATSTLLGSTWGDGAQGTGITTNGTVSLEIALTEAGQPGDYLALAWVQVRSTSTELAPTFDVDNVWVGVGEPPTGGGPQTDPVITDFSVSGGDVTLTWTADNNGTYSIQRKTDLFSPSWTDVLTGLPAGGGTTNVPVSGAGEEFYQIYGE
jgi:hypothetical protein